MSAFDWRAMRNKMLSLTLLAWVSSAAQLDAAETDADIAPARAADRAEYRPQALPDDVFTPSEEVSEDYPVAFPVDI